MPDFKIRPVGAAEFATAVEWAAGEGWNPGLCDLPAFHATDPDGFLMGFLDGMPVSSISVVRYPGDFGFLGFYIVHPAHRGRGLGLETWNAGMAYLDGCTVGLDGVVAQQDNYRKSGFKLAGRNIRHMGVPGPLQHENTNCTVRPVTADDLTALIAYDARHFPVMRESFIRNWLSPAADAGRQSLLATRNGEVAGFGTVRACRDGYKIGPLFSEDADVAAALFAGLTDSLPAGAAVALDTPEDNAAAVALAVRAGLEPVFETARMYRGPDPGLPLACIFGVTTFELG